MTLLLTAVAVSGDVKSTASQDAGGERSGGHSLMQKSITAFAIPHNKENILNFGRNTISVLATTLWDKNTGLDSQTMTQMLKQSSFMPYTSSHIQSRDSFENQFPINI